MYSTALPHQKTNGPRSSIVVQSTVIRPNATPPPEDSQVNKRPHSPPSPPPPNDASSPADGAKNGTPVKRRRLSSDQARGRRMFGALLGTLNSFQKQSSAKIARQTEKRAEIEARVKEQLAREKEELDEQREAAGRERKERLEQAKLQIANERTRLQRSLLLERAHHLSTKTSPSIYYRPYLRTSEQQALIDEQISQAQAQIDADQHGTTFRPHSDSPLKTRDEDHADEDDVERDPEDANEGDYEQEDRGSPQPLENTQNDEEEPVVLED